MDQITAEQFTEWEAYDRIDPIGTWRDDYRMAVLASLILNIVNKLYSKKGQSIKEVSPMDFMPNWFGEKREAPKQTVEDMKQVLQRIAAAARQQEKHDAKIAARQQIPASMRRPPPRKPPPMRGIRKH